VQVDRWDVRRVRILSRFKWKVVWSMWMNTVESGVSTGTFDLAVYSRWFTADMLNIVIRPHGYIIFAVIKTSKKRPHMVETRL